MKPWAAKKNPNNMIQKNVNYGISENATVADFGNGDIIVSSGWVVGEPKACVMFYGDIPNEIGKDHPERHLKSTDEIKQDIIFTFTKPESIDVLIEALEEAKNNLIKKQEEIKS